MTLREALKIAIGHIEHMSEWIIHNSTGYSFESLSEDMPDIRATLADVRAEDAALSSARILWAQLGVTSHTEASQKVAQLLAQKELIERLEARITELKDRDTDFE